MQSYREWQAATVVSELFWCEERGKSLTFGFGYFLYRECSFFLTNIGKFVTLYIYQFCLAEVIYKPCINFRDLKIRVLILAQVWNMIIKVRNTPPILTLLSRPARTKSLTIILEIHSILLALRLPLPSRYRKLSGADKNLKLLNIPK